MTVHEINPGRDRARAVRDDLFRAMRAAIKEEPDALAGFALVVWDGRGECFTAISHQSGPIGQSMVPLYVANVLNQHVAVSVAEMGLAQPIDEET
jgi:hypothetical protein